jgi:small subunit ribosomal protein S8e
MVIVQSRPKRKPSGGRYKAFRKKKLYERGRAPSLTRIGETQLKHFRNRGGDFKFRLLNASVANVLNSKTKKFEQAKIVSVIENPANRHYVRRNIITKGSIIKTDKGNARVTSRPGQDGTVNAILI